jgi:hypothetical protein
VIAHHVGRTLAVEIGHAFADEREGERAVGRSLELEHRVGNVRHDMVQARIRGEALFFCALAFYVLAELTAYHVCRLQQSRIRVALVAREKLQHAYGAALTFDREDQRAAQARSDREA